MGNYIDLCIQPIPKKHVADYKKATKIIGQLLLKHGALSSSDYVADDKNATSLSFPKKIKTKSNEVIIVAMAEFKSMAHREQVFTKMMKDPKMEKFGMSPEWMDQKKMLMGGFKTMVNLKKK